VTSLGEKREQRLRFLHLLYEKSDGNQQKHLSMWELGTELGLERPDIPVVMQYLEGEGLAEYKAMGGIIGITHWGVKQVEEALMTPEKETAYFPPAINILHIGTNIDSPIQQGSPGAEQRIGFDSEWLSELKVEVERLSEEIGNLQLTVEDESELRAQIATVLAQLKSQKPEKGILTAALRRFQPILTAGAAAGHVAEHLPGLLEMINQIG